MEDKKEVKAEIIENKEGQDKKDTTSVSEKSNTEKKVEIEEKIDWKKQYEDVQRELDQAKYTLTKKNIDSKKKEEEKKDYFGDDDEDNKEDIKEIVAGTVRSELEKAQISMRNDIITEELEKLSTDSDEMNVIKLFYENKINKTGFDRASIRKDLEFAHVLANKPRFERMLSEIQKKKESDAATTKATSSGGHKIEGDFNNSSVALSAADKALMAKYGLKPEDIKSN